ncbi:MAG: porin family protein [Mesorhizobium sp.]|uniref:outer membrane protein n=1 Tax=Mesorhizobium sp. TaxID=1871066 RepID=UPI00122BA93C|nr:outer membrane protein [Mesorhizobium sp.]TIR18267.1 MAG: porin family protein [Mesorhizobium sp.]
MKRHALALLMSAATFGTASAADLAIRSPEPIPLASEPFSWTGFYVGAQGGYSFFDSEITFPPISSGALHSSPGPDTFTLGGQAGYRYQFPNSLVLGVEGDIFSYFGKNDKAAIIGGSPSGDEITLNYGGSLRGQVGYAWDRFLPYVTGGVALLDYEGGGEAVLGGPVFPGAEFSKTKVGWTVGAGLAYALTDKLVANIDYRHSDFGSTQFATPAAAAGTTRVKLNESAIKVGMSYKF